MEGGESPAGFDRLVVIGASAGGIEALSTLVGDLPATFPAPVVIAQHLEPSHPSYLAEILGRHSSLAVKTVQEPGTQALEPGVIYVVPANRDVAISDHAVGLLPGAARQPKPSINALLRSAAEVFGEGLFAVILTGTGTDGVDGARSVHDGGGTIIVQNPATARYPALPASVIPGTIDIVANLEDIGSLLTGLITDAPLLPEPEAEATMEGLLDSLRERYGIDFARYKRPTIIRRLRRRLAATHQPALADYVRYLAAQPQEYQHLVGSFLIKVTEFFRDPALFEYLREEILPVLISQARERDRALRFWSAGCATGEEPYSLAITLAEVLGDELESFQVRIFATDIDPAAVAFARRGLYPAPALSGLPTEVVEKYFTSVDGSYEIDKRIRSLTVFGDHDLSERAPFPRIDLLTCRNVLIYFTGDLQRHVLRLFAHSLRDGGYLVLGKAESADPLQQYFSPDDTRLKVFRRHGDRISVSATTHEVPRMRPPAPGVRSGSALAGGIGRGEVQQTTRDRARDAMLALPDGVVSVNRRYDIQFINNAARRLLGIHGAVLGEDFIHVAEQVPSRELRALIDGAIRGEATDSDALAEVSIETPGAEHRRFVRISAHTRAERAEPGEDVLLVITDVTDAVQQRLALEQGTVDRQRESAHLREQMQRVLESNRELTAANDDLVAENVELRADNEEFLVGNEELQAATEEVETLNEELQATNEELETLNEELQATVEELDATNEDLQARGIELQDLALSLEAQRQEVETDRARLEAILSAMGDAMLVFDGEGRPVLTNPAFDRLFPDGLPTALDDVDGRPLPVEAAPSTLAAKGEPFAMECTLTDKQGERRALEVTGQRIDGREGEGGAVITFRDITDRSIHQLQEAFLGVASHELRTPITVLHGYLSLLLRELTRGRDPAEVRQYAELATAQVRRLERVVQDLVDVTRLRHGRLRLQLEPVELGPVVEQVVNAARLMTDGQEIELAAGEQPLKVRADAMRLEQVLLNLLSNAITHAAESERIEVQVAATDGRAEVEISDHGPGIPPSDIPNLFSRFNTTAAHRESSGRGLGLGLYISKELIEGQNGTLGVDSVEGQGTTFTVRLPLLEEER